MVQGYRLAFRLHAELHTWTGSIRLGLRHAAYTPSWRASQPSRRPSSIGEGGRTGLLVRAKQEPPVQEQHEPEQLHDAWEQACQQVAAFQWQHGRLPRTSADAQGPVLPGERPLGLWSAEQQRRKAGSKGPPLSAQEREALLGIPGWGWWATQRVRKPWEQRRQEVEAFYQQHGRLPRATEGILSPFLPGEKELGCWVDWQRQSYRGHKRTPLSAMRIAALEATPGWTWDGYIAWQQRRQEVEAFYQQHGRDPRTEAGSSNPLLPGEKDLGYWVQRQRQRHKGRQRPLLSATQIAALSAIPGWSWEEWSQEAWELRLQQVHAFVRLHGRISRQLGSKHTPLQPTERELGVWCNTQRCRQKGTSNQPPLSAQQLAALAAVPGWFFGVEDLWQQQRQHLEAFVRQHKRMPRKKGARGEPLQEGERVLGNWCITQRQRQKGTGGRSALTAKQLAALEAIPLWCSRRECT